MTYNNRRNFIKKTAIASIGATVAGSFTNSFAISDSNKGKRIGMIGLDTGHCMSFTKKLNDPLAGDKYGGYKVVAAYPKGTELIESWKNKIPEITKQIKDEGVEIVNSIDQLLAKVDVVIITCIDGNEHLKQALPVLKAGKPLFIDKPFAASLADAYAIVDAAKEYNTPMFSSSSLRYVGGSQDIADGKIGKVLGADTYSPAHLEEHHPDLYWYGVHGVEILFTMMGAGCKSVTRVFTKDTDVVTGLWDDNRIGTYRGIRSGKGGYGGTVFGEKGIVHLDDYSGDSALLIKVVEFFETGIEPVSHEETLNMFAFMQAADESKKRGGISIDIESVVRAAKAKR